MTRWLKILQLACSALPLVTATLWGTETLTYHLVSPSTFQQGCVPPCQCPTAALPIRGTFRLVPVPPGPLFATFEVVHVRWRVLSSPVPHRGIRIRGSGTYEVGGEFAVDQQLALDLRIGAQGSMHLGSGLVPGGGEFPARIDVPISTSGSCVGTIIDVHAVR